MSSVSTTGSGKTPPLWFSREMFADYWTALESRVRQDDDCDQVYTGTMRHPLIDLQRHNRDQIRQYNCELITDAVLTADPIRPTEMLIASIIVAAVAAQMVPPLAVHWDEFRNKWAIYKRAQRKIYSIAIATLQVGKSMHYARAVAYGAGTRLLTTIYEDNHRVTTRSFLLYSAACLRYNVNRAKISSSFEPDLSSLKVDSLIGGPRFRYHKRSIFFVFCVGCPISLTAQPNTSYLRRRT